MKIIPFLLLAALVAIGGREAAAQTATTKPVGLLNVQGMLQENGQPVNGFIFFCFDLYGGPTGGTSLAHDTNMNYVAVSNGVANVTYRIGDLAALSLSPTQELYLQMDVSRTGEPGSFTALSPRQRIVPSMFAASATHAEQARRLTEPLDAELLPPSVPRLDRSANFTGLMSFASSPAFSATAGPPFSVASSAMVAGLTAAAAGTASYAADSDKLDGLDSSAFWQLLGNAGTTAGLNFLGTTDNQPLELKVNNGRALRLEPSTSPNLIGGIADNSVDSGVYGATIAGGGSGGGGGTPNTVQANFGAVGGGRGNKVRTDAKEATIAGGVSNDIGSGGAPAGKNAAYAAIGGGSGNAIQNGAYGATISGGSTNLIVSNAFHAVISGGVFNTDKSQSATVGGGSHNIISTNSPYSVVAGGAYNMVSNSAAGSVISGGTSNLVFSTSTNATISGGIGNIAYGAPLATIPGGKEARALDYGQMAYASGKFSSAGDAQSSSFVLRGQSSSADSAAWAELFLDGVSERMHLVSTSGRTAWTYDILIVGRNTTGSWGFHLVGFVGLEPGAMTVTPLTTDGTSALLNARVTANLTDQSLRIETRWQLAASDTKWVASVRTAEVTLPAN